MIFNEFKYEHLDYKELKNKYISLLNKLENAKESSEFLKIFKEFNIFRGHISSMQTICSIRHTINTLDDYYCKENDYWDNTFPLLEKYENEYAKIVLNNKYKDQINIPETYYKLLENSLKCFSEEIIYDLQLENRLVTEYGKLKSSASIIFDGQTHNLASIAIFMESNDRETRHKAYKAYNDFFKDNEDEFDRIYDELVNVRNRIAIKLGYKNYTELGYVRMNRLDYDQDMVEKYRNEVIKYVVPLTVELRKKQAQRIGVDKLECYDLAYNFNTGNPKPHGDETYLVAQARKMYHEISKETGDFFDIMVDKNLFDLPTKPNKEMGGYCTDIFDYKVPFIFANFNGTQSDVDTLTHEAGHAFQSYCSFGNCDIPELNFPTMETAEIHSMTMEFFAHPYSEYFFKEDTSKYHYFHLNDAISFLPYGCLVDHFQHEIYNNPTMSKTERKRKWRELEKIYKPDIDYGEFDLLERGGFFYRQGHIFQSPFYYIDYTLAQVCALQFYVRMLNKDENVWNDYLNICKLGGTKSFTQVVKEAHLISPFEKDCLKEVVKTVELELNKINDSDL